ncbi:MAG: hypothetical protein D6712_20610, partial [Chloroflexi bacterium]
MFFRRYDESALFIILYDIFWDGGESVLWGAAPRPATFCKKWAKTFLGERPRCASGLRKCDKGEL